MALRHHDPCGVSAGHEMGAQADRVHQVPDLAGLLPERRVLGRADVGRVRGGVVDEQVEMALLPDHPLEQRRGIGIDGVVTAHCVSAPSEPGHLRGSRSDRAGALAVAVVEGPAVR